jgi:hypothetical protein
MKSATKPERTCPICQTVTTDAVADHAHDTGIPREFLCRSCNAGLGMFKDNPASLRTAALYLEKHQANRDLMAYLTTQTRTLHRRTHERRARAALIANET